MYHIIYKKAENPENKNMEGLLQKKGWKKIYKLIPIKLK